MTSRKFNVIYFVGVFYLGGDNKREGELCVLVREVLEGFCLSL